LQLCGFAIKQFALIREIRVKARRLILIFARPRIQTALVTSRVNLIKNLALFLFSVFLLSGCTTTKTYTPNTADGPAKPADYPIPLYNTDTRIPRPYELIGEFSIGDTPLTMSGGSMKGVMKTLMDTAHEKGADVVQIVSVKRPDFESAHYRVKANLLRYTDKWETVPLSEKDLLAYLQTHRQTLDPIEGIWFNEWSERVGIIKDHSKPGRDFIAFTLGAPLPSWQNGYKKMDIARGERPGTYDIKYYRDDFAVAKTSVRLEQGHAFTFIIRSGDEARSITFVKVGAPVPAN
jgi:hypothetical protein